MKLGSNPAFSNVRGCFAFFALINKKILLTVVMYTHFYINKYIFTPLAFVLLFVMSRHTNCLVYLYIYILKFKL